MDNNKIRILFVANFITLFGSSFLFIPISRNFSLYFGVGMSWAMVYFIMRAPPVLFARLYANLANKYGVKKIISASQFFALVGSFVMLLGAYFKINFLAILGFTLVCSFSLILRTLYPSYLNLLSINKNDLQKHLSNWQIILFGAFVFGTGLGGLVYELVSIEFFILVDALTFLLAFILWQFNLKEPDSKLLVKQTNTWSLKQFLTAFFLPLNMFMFFKKLAYGFINPMIAVVLLEKFGQSTAALGYVYCIISITSMLGAKVSKLKPVSYISCTIASVAELMLAIYFVITDSLFLSVLSMCAVVFFMAIADVNAQTLYMDKYKKEDSNNLSSVFEAVRNGSQLIGFAVFMIIAKFNVFTITTVVLMLCCFLSLILMANHKFIFIKDDNLVGHNN